METKQKSIEKPVKRCVQCLLPENYFGISFNEKGVCNYCNAFFNRKQRTYVGDDALRNKIERFLENKPDRNKTYDCVVGFSGGRDSTYLLYYLVKKLRLKVLAFHVDNGFVPEQTKVNIQNAVEKLNVKLVIEKNDDLDSCIRHHITSWIEKPSVAMIETICIGCRYGYMKKPKRFIRKEKIPVYISGGTPFENVNYRVNYFKLRPNSSGSFELFLGAALHMLKHPKVFLNGKIFIIQLKEYLYYFLSLERIKRKLGIKNDVLHLSPFYNYIKWDEKQIFRIIGNELNWKKDSRTESAWKVDCDIAFLKLYLYEKILGFNDKIECLSNLIRDKQLSREDALNRLTTEENIPDEIIKELFDRLGLDFLQLKKAIQKVRETT